MDIQKEREAFQKFCEENFDFERHEQTYFDEQTQCYENDIGEDTESINMAWSAWQAAKSQAVPEGKYILQTFSTYSGVCEDTFNHKNIGVFGSIDAAMFHARNIGLVMNHYGYEFRVIEAQEPSSTSDCPDEP